MAVEILFVAAWGLIERDPRGQLESAQRFGRVTIRAASECHEHAVSLPAGRGDLQRRAIWTKHGAAGPESALGLVGAEFD